MTQKKFIQFLISLSACSLRSHSMSMRSVLTLSSLVNHRKAKCPAQVPMTSFYSYHEYKSTPRPTYSESYRMLRKGLLLVVTRLLIDATI